jgi:hypothetical protein
MLDLIDHCHSSITAILINEILINAKSARARPVHVDQRCG